MIEVELATTGAVDRDDTCATCGEPMFYRVDASGRVVSSMCAALMTCPAALLEIPEQPK